jgi:hypothetical protein
MLKVVHIKSGRICYVINDNVVNATNALDGRREVVYIGKDKNTKELKLFTRNYEEFSNKFRIANSDDISKDHAENNNEELTIIKSLLNKIIS